MVGIPKIDTEKVFPVYTGIVPATPMEKNSSEVYSLCIRGWSRPMGGVS